MSKTIAAVCTLCVPALFSQLALAGGMAQAADAEGSEGPFDLPAIGGWVMAPDGQTLIVSTGSGGELVYFNTAAAKEDKRVEVDFQPTCLAIQGDNLLGNFLTAQAG